MTNLLYLEKEELFNLMKSESKGRTESKIKDENIYKKTCQTGFFVSNPNFFTVVSQIDNFLFQRNGENQKLKTRLAV